MIIRHKRFVEKAFCLGLARIISNTQMFTKIQTVNKRGECLFFFIHGILLGFLKKIKKGFEVIILDPDPRDHGLINYKQSKMSSTNKN
jgi:hypothetical protein